MKNNLNKLDLISSGNSLVLIWKKQGINPFDENKPSNYRSAVIAIEFTKHEFVNKNYQPNEKYYNDFLYVVTIYDPEAEHDLFNKEYLLKNPWKAKQLLRTKMLVHNETDDEIVLRGIEKNIVFDTLTDSLTIRFKKNSNG